MSLSVGTHLGPYEIIGLLGAGGMGVVHRAHDARLKRDVALKILPGSFAADADRLARFQREAEVLASLSHPNIAAIYGLEEANGVRALVLELVEGDTLADLIERRPSPSEPAGVPGPKGRGLHVDEALLIARQIADALDSAHERGIIHRDLKPANVKVTPEGHVKVLDFGLAKLNDPNVPSVPHDPNDLNATQSPTLSLAATRAGVILGTAAYMSPEQARGKPVDKRSDIWAFGCVLYEMLTSRRAFDGQDITDTIVAVVSKEPEWDALPAATPAPIRALLRRCLEKDAKRRLRDIGEARLAIEEASSTPAAQQAVRATVGGPAEAEHYVHERGRRLALLVTGALLVGAIVAGSIAWLALRPAPPRISQLALPTTPATALTINGVDRDLAITPDGSRVIYVGNNGRELFVRPLDTLEPVSLFTGAPRAPFVSPDGQWVGFVDGVSVLKKVAITGGPPVTIAAIDGVSRGATWTPADTIIFATNSTATGLQEVAAAGGPVTV